MVIQACEHARSLVLTSRLHTATTITLFCNFVNTL
jgi:hypothetical protein